MNYCNDATSVAALRYGDLPHWIGSQTVAAPLPSKNQSMRAPNRAAGHRRVRLT